ncbi:hypothetical protein QFX18_05255 [Saccharophagus degradans]|uniref:hypothetical protein n=1 Tax=Saccharophagus degradans TaxID=86304 RepID=UPI002477DD87|nr:hypothetical protein [Saccharophagus degradans]WGO96675.1 hypothetical protein QFX18_11520 [Saccharophagus degradans]WGO99468.1 hypothetical protein QFX18_05255 [Saccharophagus degradans]
MKKYIIASIITLLSLNCHAGEWVAVGDQPELLDVDQIEKQLWEYLKAKSKVEFKKRDAYRYQYKYIDEASILINALCLQAPEGGNDPGTYPGPTTEELKIQLYQVYDGGSCFFNIEYDLKNGYFNSLYINGRA